MTGCSFDAGVSTCAYLPFDADSAVEETETTVSDAQADATAEPQQVIAAVLPHAAPGPHDPITNGLAWLSQTLSDLVDNCLVDPGTLVTSMKDGIGWGLTLPAAPQKAASTRE
jgi:hypothetical protein